MKKLLPLLTLLFPVLLSAQVCNINTSYTQPGIYPDTLPTATVGQPYSADITFVLPLDTMGYDFTNFHILTCTLPVGLTWQCNASANNCNYDPWVNQYGCVNVSGTPLLAGFYPIAVTVIADLTIATGIPVTFQVYINIVPNNSSSSNNGFTMTGFEGCAPITVNFTNNNPGLVAYAWNFGNSNQSTAENPAPQVYTQPGNYYVHYEAYADTTTNHFYTLTSITIQSIQNSASVWGYPIDGNPDLFVIVKENGTPVYQSSYFADQFPVVGWYGLNINMNPANTYVLEVWDEDDHEFGFGGDDFIGSHTMSLNGCAGCAANISVVDYTVSHTVVPPTPSVITNDTVRVHGYPGIPNVVYDSLNHVLTTDTTAYTLQWYLNGSPLLGENAPSDTVWISGYYNVIAVNQWGCASFSDTVLAVYCDTAWHPSVAQNGTVLSTIDTTGNTMQWYLNGNPLPGQTADQVNALLNGLYMLEITNQYGCVFYSAPVVVSTGFGEHNVNKAYLFPNPANETVNISWGSAADHTTVQLLDISGRVVHEQQVSGTTATLSVAQYPEGTYFVNVITTAQVSTAKLIIAR